MKSDNMHYLGQSTLEKALTKVAIVDGYKKREGFSYDLEKGEVNIPKLIGTGFRTWETDKDGYIRILEKKQGKNIVLFKHQILLILKDADEFIRMMFVGMTVDHINGEKQDNAINNLQFFTREMNAAKNQKKQKRLSVNEVMEILYLHHVKKLGWHVISHKVGCSGRTVQNVLQGKSHVKLAQELKQQLAV